MNYDHISPEIKKYQKTEYIFDSYMDIIDLDSITPVKETQLLILEKIENILGSIIYAHYSQSPFMFDFISEDQKRDPYQVLLNMMKEIHLKQFQIGNLIDEKNQIEERPNT